MVILEDTELGTGETTKRCLALRLETGWLPLKLETLGWLTLNLETLGWLTLETETLRTWDWVKLETWDWVKLETLKEHPREERVLEWLALEQDS